MLPLLLVGTPTLCYAYVALSFLLIALLSSNARQSFRSMH